MAHFLYLAQDNQNKQTKGKLEARDLLEAKTKLKQLGLYIIWVRKESRVVEKLGLGRIKNLDLAIFSHQFSVMISSGIPLIRTLKALEDEASKKKLRTIINKVRFDVENGTSLSDALLKHPKVFSNLFINLVKTGEVAGILPMVLNRLANYLEKEEDLRRKVVSSFAYPVVVGVVAGGVVSFLLIFIVPVFRSVYKTLKISLPGPTLALIVLSNILIKFWWLILLCLGLIYYLLRVAQGNTAFGLTIDKFKLRLPLFGQLHRKVAVSRFVRTLSTMISSGLPLTPSLNIVKEVVGNRVIFNNIEAIQKEINQGRSLSDALQSREVFPPIVVQMLSVGEESGNLSAMLDKCADFLDEDIDTLIKSLVVKLEPTLTFFLAVLVGFIALAIYLPMFDLIRQISQ
jgi:type IV pilus assembly protein PilC